MDRIDCMQAFVASIDHGSLSRAAHALGRSITAVSRAVGALEERLGATLLIRTTRTLKLTDAGDRYLPVCRTVLAELAEAELCAGGALDAYLARRGTPAAPRALAKHRCISFTALTPTDTWTFASGPEGGRAKHVKVEPVLTVNTAEAAIASAIAGQGVTCALSYQIAAPLRAETLTAILTAYETPPRPLRAPLRPRRCKPSWISRPQRSARGSGRTCVRGRESNLHEGRSGNRRDPRLARSSHAEERSQLPISCAPCCNHLRTHE